MAISSTLGSITQKLISPYPRQLKQKTKKVTFNILYLYSHYMCDLPKDSIFVQILTEELNNYIM